MESGSRKEENRVKTRSTTAKEKIEKQKLEESTVKIEDNSDNEDISDKKDNKIVLSINNSDNKSSESLKTVKSNDSSFEENSKMAGEDGEETQEVVLHRHFNYGDILKVLPQFDPVKENLSITKWIEKIEEFKTLYEWDDVTVQHYALASLSGVARKWKESLPAPTDGAKRTWEDWKKELKSEFPDDDDDPLALRKEAENYKRKTDQNITEYYYEKLAKCNKAEMKDKEIIQLIVMGLNNVRFQDYLGPLNRYETPSKLLPVLKSGAKYIQETTVSKPKCFSCNQVGHKSNACLNKSDKNNFEKKDKSEKKEKKDLSDIKCYSCNEMGHFSYQCEKNKNSGKKYDRKTAKSEVKQENSVLVVNQNTHAKYFKDAKINGKEVRCYVDMGCSVVALREDKADEIGLSYYETQTEPLVGYGNGQVQPCGIVTASLSIDEVETKVKVYIVPKNSQNIELLVGHPFTEHSDVIILSTCDDLRIVKNMNDLYKVEAEKKTKTAMWASEAQVIPSNFLGNIMVITNFKNTEICVEGGLRKTGHLIPRCLVKTDDAGVTCIPVLNASEKDYTVKQGKIVTRGETCKEISAVREVNTEPILESEIDTDVEGENKKLLLKVLNDYKDLIARNMKQLGCANNVEVTINLSSQEPICYKPYRLSFHEREKIIEMINELKSAVIVEDSTSPFASPILLVKKKMVICACA